MSAPADPMAAALADGGYGDLWNYLVRDGVVDAVWREPDSRARLTAIAADEAAPLRARFLASEILFERHPAFVDEVGRAAISGIYARALLENLTGAANSWGLLQEHDDAGPTGIRFVQLGTPAIAVLRPLLDDDRVILRYLGSKAATVGKRYGFRVKDFAAYYLSRITGLSLAYHRAPADRDRAIAALAAQLPGQSESPSGA